MSELGTWAESGRYVLAELNRHEAAIANLAGSCTECKEDRVAEINALNLKIERLAWKVGLIIGVLLFCGNILSKIFIS